VFGAEEGGGAPACELPFALPYEGCFCLACESCQAPADVRKWSLRTSCRLWLRYKVFL